MLKLAIAQLIKTLYTLVRIVLSIEHPTEAKVLPFCDVIESFFNFS